MAASENKKKKCETVIPSEWPKFTTPAYTPGMTAAQARSAWYEYLRATRTLSPTPRIYRHQS